MSEKKNLTTAKFFLAEDIRMEAGGKPILLGLYANDVITVDLPKDAPEASPDHPLLLQEVAILSTFPEANGKFSGTLSMTDPSGKVILDTGPTEFKTDSYGYLNIASRFRPLAIEKFGQYIFNVTLDESQFEYKFEITKSSASAVILD